MSSLFSEDEKKFIKENSLGKTTTELTDMFNKTFNRQLKVSQIRNFKKSRKIKSGVDCRFRKASTPHNYKPIGSEFVSSDGYTYIKVADPNTWEQKQRYLYKKYKGEIPNNCSVVFANQDKQDFNLDNLILIANKDKLVMKNKHLFFNNKESTETGILIAKVINKCAQLKKD